MWYNYLNISTIYRKNFYSVALLFVLFTFFSNSMQASHLMGGDLTYVSVGGNSYRIKLTLYRDCSGVAMDPSEVIAISSTNCSVSTSAVALLEPGYPIELSSLCPAQLGNSTCNGGTLLGVQEYVYSVVYTLPTACTDWTFSYTNCCRNYGITTGPAAQSFYFEAKLNSVLAPGNNSPDFYTKPIPFFGVGQPQNYSHATNESDGDVLVYSIVTPRQNVGTPVTYNAPWSYTYPVTTASGTYSINSATGQIQFTPILVQNSVTAVLVEEFRNGVLIGSVLRDIQIIVINGLNGGVAIGPINNLTGATMNPGQSYVMTACSGVPISFDIQVNDITGGVPVVSDNASVILDGGAAITYSGTNPKTLSFTWTPPASSVGYNSFYILASDHFCPIPSVATANIVIYITGVKITAPRDSVCAGEQLQLNASIFGNASGTYTWSGQGLSATNIASPTATPVSLPQTYSVNYSYGGCNSTDDFTVYPGGTINATPPLSNICPGQTVQLAANAVMPFAASGTGCGLSSTTCAGAASNYTIGTGASTVAYPFSGYWHDGRTQLLYTAAELAAAGITAGNINQIGFNVITKGSTLPYSGFTIKLGCTAATALTGYVAGMTSVYSVPSMSTVVGWNTFTLPTPYQWDGTSSLVVEICYDNSTYSNYDFVAYTTTPSNRVYFRYQDNVVGCSLTSGTASTSRANIRINHCTNLPPVTYTWTPALGLSAANIPNPVATAGASNRMYFVEVAGGGCLLRDTVELRTSNLVNASPDSTGACNGSGMTINLNVSTFITPVTTPPACGANSTACGSSAVDYTLGSATSSAGYPFSGLYEDGRTQMLFRAGELTALGLTGGKLTAIALLVQAANSTIPYSGLTISIGCTNLTSLSGFQSGLTTVYSGNYTMGGTTGWKTFPFSTGYGWDGTSNLIVQICYNNTAYSDDDFLYASNTTFLSTYYAANDGVTGCTMSTGTATNIRPNIRFTCCTLSSALTYAWSPATDLNDPAIANPVSTPNGSIVYTVTVSNGVCSGTDNVEINVENCILPADELALTASLRKEESYFVELDWVTQNEQKTASYEIQRRYPDETGFQRIAQVNALGNEGETRYQYQDDNLRPVTGEQTIYYRIREIDTDGAEFFTPFIEVKIAPDNLNIGYYLYPNPASTQLNLELENNNVSVNDLTLFISDNMGRSFPVTPSDLYNRKLSIDIASLPSGTYVLTVISQDGKRTNQKFIKTE